MISRQEQYEIQLQVHREMIAIERQVANAGTFRYLCLVAGVPTLTHQPVGPVLRTVR